MWRSCSSGSGGRHPIASRSSGGGGAWGATGGGGRGGEAHRLGSLVLVLRANGRTHRLSGVAELPSDGQGSWRAGFAWKGQPLPVEAAELEVGRDLVVPLPAPRRQRSRFARTEAPDADSAP